MLRGYLGDFCPDSVLAPRGDREVQLLQHLRAAPDEASKAALAIAGELVAGLAPAEPGEGGEVAALAAALEALRVALGGV